jgi:uncharacterized protein
MEYNVSHLLKSPVGTTREYNIEPADLALDDETTAHIRDGHARFDRTNTGVLARGSVGATVTVSCARCLDPVDEPVDVGFTEEFEPTIDVSTGRPLPASENELAFPIDQHHILDLGEAIRQNMLAALPIAPLCRDDCAGLCPVCGVNRNTDPCACVADEANRPFAELPELLLPELLWESS